MTSSSSVKVSSPNKWVNGPPSLCITMLELELVLVVLTACPVPGAMAHQKERGFRIYLNNIITTY